MKWGVPSILEHAIEAPPQTVEALSHRIAALGGDMADKVVRELAGEVQKLASAISPEMGKELLRGIPSLTWTPSGMKLPPLPSKGLWQRRRFRSYVHRAFEVPLQHALMAYARELKQWLASTHQTMRQAARDANVTIPASEGNIQQMRADAQRLRDLLEVESTNAT